MSMKVPQIVREVQQAIQDGYCVVIGLQTTGEVCMISELYYVFIIGEFSNECCKLSEIALTCFTTLCDWSKYLAPLCQPIRR